jgi:2-oxoglutarate dehydrogenase E2 component (dihydrolipoamide succinyltransferase)
MALEMKVPTVGESISEVTIGQWFKNDGDFVNADEIIAELESDKATFELPAEASGILRIKAQEGDTVEVGGLICEIEESEGGAAGPAASNGSEAPAVTASPKASPAEANASTGGKPIDMVVPTVGESITEVTIGQWLKEDGDLVAQDEIIAEIESDKATFELPAEAAGILRIKAQEGDTLEIGALICQIEPSTESAAAPAAKASGETSAPKAGAQPASQEGYAAGHPSPAAAKILAEKGISPEAVKGSGPGGRITKEDAQGAKAPQAKPAATAGTQPAASAQPAASGSRNQRRERMSSLRKTISRRLVSVKNETAMLTTFNEVNMKPIMDLRKQYKDKFKEKHEIGLGFMSFFTKAVCVALQEWPAVNAQIDGNEIVYNDYCDISIAVSTPKGLVVPVIRNAEALSFAGVEKEIMNLAIKARDGKLSIEEMQGGTFTITNGGVFGSMMSTPIINAPQSAILGMHNIVERPMAVNGEVKILPMMYVALSYDHRIIDGRESVSFLVRVKELLEDPARLLLGV